MKPLRVDIGVHHGCGGTIQNVTEYKRWWHKYTLEPHFKCDKCGQESTFICREPLYYEG